MHAVVLILALSLTHGDIPSLTSTHHPSLKVHHRVYRHHRRYLRPIVFHSPLRGSHESLLRQNLRANEDDLERIQNDAQLEQLAQNGELVGLPADRAIGVAPRLPEERRYCRPWTRTFLEDLGQKFYARFHQPLVVTSAVRPADFQEQLRRHNHNAAAEDGDAASPHLTGATVDIGKRGLTRKELVWTRDYLLNLQNLGLVDAEEEFRQRVFHITVYRDYEAYMQPSEASLVASPAQ